MIGSPMKAEDMRKCDRCNQGLMRNGAITFWRIYLERMVVDVNAVKAIGGLSAILGSERLATILAPNDNVAVPVTSPDEAIICDACAMDHDTIFELAEEAAKSAEKRKQR